MIIIGIDPGVKTGIAIWSHEGQIFQAIKSRNIIEAMAEVKLIMCVCRDVKLIIEDARMVRFRTDPNRAQGAGSVKRDCKVWEEFCEFNKLDYEMKRPNKRITKLKADAFKKLTGWNKQTNEHGRDAAMLVFKR